MQSQLDELFDEANNIHTDLDLCIKSTLNTLTDNVTLNGAFKFCDTTPSEIAHLSGVTSNIQTLCDDAIKRHGSPELFSDVTLSGYEFCGASAAEISTLTGITSNIQTQCDNAIKKSGTTALMSNVVLTGVYKFIEPHPLNSVIVVVLHPVYKLNSTIACETITPLL